ncbi:Carbonic anhydrase 2 [Methyloligella halotolerans]|uniref:carbonic anhydrase n=1 Tax=Methyloligella halotolerans TaxID=1177755 RepID=A0A1E2RXE8_9HYPH|nr:carbonic anhydrase [Methyloligella halotolerans]ODA66810.1 Carbonic anhydrase 2 [Methyloligella halotolerans]
MCEKHCGAIARKSMSVDRRTALTFGLGAAAALAMPFAAKAEEAAPPRPQNVMEPDAALERLMAGNERYIKGEAKPHDFVAERPALVSGQNPFAGVLSCADSRIAPELAFDTSRGDLFVCRVAGNFVTPDNLASFEFATAVLNTPLILVLGHDACGAVASTISSIEDDETLPGHLPALVEALTPAVKQASAQGHDNLLERSIEDNVRLNVEKLKTSSPILDEAVGAGKLKVVGGVYKLETGKVELISGTA